MPARTASIASAGRNAHVAACTAEAPAGMTEGRMSRLRPSVHTRRRRSGRGRGPDTLGPVRVDRLGVATGTAERNVCPKCGAALRSEGSASACPVCAGWGCYRGEIVPGGAHISDRVRVTRPDGSELNPAPSLALRNHNPAGFAWDHEGGGPAQLALALLLDLTGDRGFAVANYDTFRTAVVAHWPWPPKSHGVMWSLPVRDLDAWLQDAVAHRGAPRRWP